MAEIDLGNVTFSDFDFNVYESLDCEEAITGYLQEALAGDDVPWMLESLADVAIARIINQIAGATGADRKRLCKAFSGEVPLDTETVAKVKSACPTLAVVG
jgi:probable addiction module antidote protein